MPEIDFDANINDAPMTESTDFDPAEFLVTPREEKAAMSKLEAEQAAVAAETAYKLALKDKPLEPEKFRSNLAKNSGQKIDSPFIVKSYDLYLPEYTSLLATWREKYPEASERFDREVRAAQEKKEKAALAAKNKKRKADMPATPLGELVKKLLTDFDSMRYNLKELEKHVEAQAENGHAAEVEKKEELA
jgi:hypothetical protein